MTRRGRGRPPLTEGEAPVKRTVLLPPDLDAEAERVKGAVPWAAWLRRLVEKAARRQDGDTNQPDPAED